ncbi:MAG: glycosyltransferase family 4 protein [Eggerthellaceae bacterium]|nr:glycosyltransferase family 4 protein [Eggerthellaceae bacterium]
MKVLMINHFPLEGSGSGTYTKNLATQLAKLGHEVCIILPQNTTSFPGYAGVRLHPVYFTDTRVEEPEAIPGALPFNFPCFTTHPVSITAFDDLDAAQTEAYLAAFRAAIQQEVAEFQPDVIHGQHVWALPSLAVDCGVPLVLTAHGTDLMGYDKWPEMRHYAATAMEAAVKVICISADNEELVRTAFPQYADKIVRMRNGYNPDIFYPQQLDRAEVLGRYGLSYSGEDVILFAGKMTRFKGIDVLLDAAAKYEAQLPNAITVLAGDGEERPNLEAQAERLGLQRVTLIGNVAQDALAQLYSIADIDLVPSRREPFGLVAVEAMACGTPVVATNQGGLPDFVNHSVGELVNPEDADDLARGVVETLERALANPAWREEVAAYASGNYSQAAIIRELEALYLEVIGS